MYVAADGKNGRQVNKNTYISVKTPELCTWENLTQLESSFYDLFHVRTLLLFHYSCKYIVTVLQ